MGRSPPNGYDAHSSGYERLAPTLSSRCFDLAGNGAAKAAVRYVLDKLPANQFVFRTDVKSYYVGIF